MNTLADFIANNHGRAGIDFNPADEGMLLVPEPDAEPPFDFTIGAPLFIFDKDGPCTTPGCRVCSGETGRRGQ